MKRNTPIFTTLAIGTALFLTTALAIIAIQHQTMPNCIGYVYCHQMPSRSPFAGQTQLAFCYRCIGLFMGICTVFLIHEASHLRKTAHEAKIFSKPRIAFFAICFFFFGFDSLNGSFFFFLLGIHPLYASIPLLRTLSGFGMGATVMLIVLPIFQLVFYAQPAEDKMIIDRNKEKLALIASCIALLTILKAQSPFFLHIVNWLSTLTALFFPVFAYAIILLAITKNINAYATILEGKNILLGAFLLCLLQIALITLIRYHITDGWGWQWGDAQLFIQ